VTITTAQAPTPTPTLGWEDVTIAEFAAIALVNDPEPVARINAYWATQHALGRYPFNAEPPALSPEGVQWLMHWRIEAGAVTNRPAEFRNIARTILGVLGTLTVLQA
jgi:hypothetical protein